MTLDEASEIFRLEPVGTVGSRAQLCAAIVVSLSLGNGLKIELECAAKVMHLDLGDLDAVGRKLVGLGDG